VRILFAEPHEAFTEVVTRQFLASHEVRVAATLEAARAALDEAAFDAVLLTIFYEDGRGTELVTELEARPQRPFIVAIAAYDEENAELMSAGADAVCGKLHFSQIEGVLRSLQN
jgi:DNA-binding response OmpR family regulator